VRTQLLSGFVLVVTLLSSSAWAQTDLQHALKDNVAEHWIYDDVEKAFEQAKETGKPILAVFR